MDPEPVAPFFEDLRVGQVSRGSPAITLTDGHAAVHQSILGDRLRLPLDADLSRRVTGGRLAHPGLVCDIAIGQSTLLTQRVIANLFYRGLVFHRAPFINDTLSTTVEVVGLRENSHRPGRRPTGLAALRVRTVDQEDRPVLDFWRCAMLPLRDVDSSTGHADDLDEIGIQVESPPLTGAIETWRLEDFRNQVGGPRPSELALGRRWEVVGGDVVSSAPELARLTLNVAIAHHDGVSTGQGRRLVYGGHTIGLACSQIVRVLPNLATIVAWRSCDHLAPVYEGDTLHTEVELERIDPIAGDSAIANLRARVSAGRPDAERDVLDWRLVGVLA